MAKITASSEEKVFKIEKWLGLNENPDGDTRLKLGEAAVMRNFKITRDGSLQKRPGLGSLGHLVHTYQGVIDVGEPEEYAYNSGGAAITVSETIIVDEYTGDLSFETTISIAPESVNTGTYYFESGSSKYYRLISFDGVGDDGWNHFTVCQVAAQAIPSTNAVQGLWSGHVAGLLRFVAVTYGGVISIEGEGLDSFRTVGEVLANQRNEVAMFGFEDKLYLVCSNKTTTSHQYAYMYSWDGEADVQVLHEDKFYIPVVAIGVSPAAGVNPFGATLQRVNLLSRYRRVWLSPTDISSTTFNLPETAKKITYVKSLVTGEAITDYSTYDVNVNGRVVTSIAFSTETTLVERHIGENTIEVAYRADMEEGPSATGLDFIFPDGGKITVEQYNGQTDNRLFFCCETSNKIYYTDLDYNGQPRADYIPDLNVITVGESSDTVTGMIRHYSRLIVYKKNSTYSIQYGTLGLADGTTTAAFYCTPVNKRIGNEAFGQVELVLNSPRTLHGKDLYEWRNNASYSSNLTVDERQARRISDRIYRLLGSFDFSRCYCYDDNDHQEYYIICDKKALVHNYAADAWYYYDNFDVTCMCNFGGELYAGDSAGRLNLLSRENRTDNGEVISAYWESGSEAFGKEFMRKYSAQLWVSLKPENRSEVTVTAMTDRNGVLEDGTILAPLPEMTAAASFSTFADADFRAWSFGTSRMPKISRTKIKAKKFVYYKLIFKTASANTTATIVSADLRVRFTGYAR